MKRIYMIVALLGALTNGAFAQSYIDLEAFMEKFDDSVVICNDTYIDTNVGYWGVINRGPESVVGGDMIWLKMPFTSDTFGAGTISGYQISEARDSGSVVIWFNANVYASDITYLLDINKWENADSVRYWDTVMIPKSALVDGRTYGFFFYIVPVIGSDPNIENPSVIDTVRSNNMVYKPIVWCGDMSNINELISGKKTERLLTYPNPANREINFRYDFLKTADATVRITDIAGRTVLVKDLGKNVQGIQTFNIDCSSLTTGTYFLEFQTDGKRAVSKFNVVK